MSYNGKHSLKMQGSTLLTYLWTHPDSDIHALKRELFDKHGQHASYVHIVIATVRNVLGDEVVTCRYDKLKRAYVYACATDRKQGFTYVTQRKVKVKNEAQNLVKILDRIEVKWPGDPEVAYARILLDSVANMLSVSKAP